MKTRWVKHLLFSLYDSSGAGTGYTVTGVLKDAPQYAHFTFNFLGSFKTLEVALPYLVTQEGWSDNRYYTYVLLSNKNDINTLKAKLPAFAERHIGREMKQWKSHYDFLLQPLTAIHLTSHLRDEIEPNGNLQYIYIFTTVAVFILLISFINYINLSTARAVQRAKEVCTQKILGAGNARLVAQYLSEAVLVAFISLA